MPRKSSGQNGICLPRDKPLPLKISKSSVIAQVHQRSSQEETISQNCSGKTPSVEEFAKINKYYNNFENWLGYHEPSCLSDTILSANVYLKVEKTSLKMYGLHLFGCFLSTRVFSSMYFINK